MADGALDVALALWRQPSLRPALRAQPLPDDVGILVDLAAGAPDRVARAAAQAGEPADDVLDAVRFYLREVVLHADGDAYRVLGAAADAPGARLKAHHRTLQHWLHPDRRGREDDAVYAARINTAWSLLRTPERRAAYDAAHAGGDADASAGAHRVLVSGWRADGPQPRRRREGALLVLAAALCGWLLLLAGRQALAPPPEWEPVGVQEDAAAAMQPLAVLATRGSSTTDTVASAGSAGTVSTAGASEALRASTPMPTPVAPASRLVRAGAPAAQAPPATIQWGDGTRAAGGASAQAPEASSAGPGSGSGAESAAQTRIRAVRDVDDARVAAFRPLPPPRRPAAPAPVAIAAPTTVLATAAAAALPPSAATTATAAPAAPAATTASPPPGAPPRAMPIAPPPDVDAARALAAQRRGQQLTAYLQGSGERAPPIWASATALDSAEAARGRFDAGSGGGLQLGDAAWRIASTRASMTAPVRAHGDAAGQLHVELAWRNGTWLVDRLQLDAPTALAP